MNEKIEKYEVFGGVPVPDDRYLTEDIKEGTWLCSKEGKMSTVHSLSLISFLITRNGNYVIVAQLSSR